MKGNTLTRHVKTQGQAEAAPKVRASVSNTVSVRGWCCELPQPHKCQRYDTGYI